MPCSFSIRIISRSGSYDVNAPSECYCIVHDLPALNSTIYDGGVCAVGAIEQATEKALNRIEAAHKADK